ncbi:MAG: hypothetical protein AMXMBFR13_14650 [Phycisphaerae bacterium]
MRWAGRLSLAGVCILALGGVIAVSYRGDAGGAAATCGTCTLPVLANPADLPDSMPAMDPTMTASRSDGDAPAIARSPEVIVFYFHRTLRCPSCLQIEEWAKQATETYFAGELADGLVQWRAVNTEEAGNEHFEKDYGLTAQSLVLARMSAGRRTEWKNLEDVWELLGDHARFTDYVRTELSSFLGGASAPQSTRASQEQE